MTKNIAIIYHDADFDGKLSNEVCRFYLKLLHHEAAIHSYGWDYGRPVPLPIVSQQPPDVGCPTTQGDGLLEWRFWDAIYIVDLSVDELMARPELRDKIVWIDHHKSAIEKWENRTAPISGNPVPNFDGLRIDGVAACRLCWQWFTRRNRVGVTYTRPVSKQDFVDRAVEEPELIRLAGEYDVWDHRDADAKVLQFGLRALNQDDFDALVHYQFACGPAEQVDRLYLKPVIELGRAIKSYCDKQADELSNEVCRFHLDQLYPDAKRFCN